jgi:hypothetical protein
MTCAHRTENIGLFMLTIDVPTGTAGYNVQFNYYLMYKREDFFISHPCDGHLCFLVCAYLITACLLATVTRPTGVWNTNLLKCVVIPVSSKHNKQAAGVQETPRL